MPEPKVLIVKKADAAARQLQTAIWLWFNNGDPVAVHTLAVAANDCYNSLGKHKGSPSVVQKFIAAQSENYQKKTREPQNFFKHGSVNLKGKVSFTPKHAEVLMFDAAICHDRINGKLTPLMDLFILRFALSHRVELKGNFLQHLPDRIPVDVAVQMTRAEFFDFVLPLLTPVGKTP